MSTNDNIEEGTEILENARRAQDQYFNAVIQLIDRQDVEIRRLRAENEKLKTEES